MNDADNAGDELESLVGQVADEYTDRVNRGEPVELEEYARRYPQIADLLREVLPSLGLLGQLASKEEDERNVGTGTVPSYLGDYHIIREVGRGGMGVVYEAEQKSLGRHVALKILPFHRLMDPLHLKRFQREAQAAARLHHTNIVPVFGVGEHEGIHFYAMQYIDGLGLDRVIDELREIRERAGASGSTCHTNGILRSGLSVSLSDQSFTQYCGSVARIGVQVADALAYAHREGLLHRDVKPSNLLLDSTGRIWVTDFGLAKADSGEALTQTGDMVGTLRYSAPERLAGRSDIRSDIFSFGLTLYELLTLRPAYDETHQGLLVQQVANGEPPTLRKLDRRIPADLETIVQKATAKEPERRYQDAGEVAEDLRRYLADRPVQARRSSALEKGWRWCRRNPAIAIISALSLLTLFSGVTAVVWEWRRAETNLVQAEANFAKARQAVDDCFSTVTEDPAFQEPGQEAARKVLFQTALKYYQDFLAQRSGDPTVRLDLARAYTRVGFINDLIASKTDAVTSYEKACELYDEFVQAHPDEPIYRAELARSCESLARLYQSTSRLDAAETQFRKALELRDVLAQEHPDEWQYGNEMANGYRSLARLYRTSGRPQEAEVAGKRALGERRELVRNQPTTPAFQSALAQDRLELVRLYDKSSRPQEAVPLLNEALSGLEQLVHDHPSNAEYRHDLATAYYDSGTFSFLRRSTDGTLAAYRKSQQLYEQLMGDYPRVLAYQSELAQVYDGLGVLHWRREEPVDAEHCFSRAIDLQRALVTGHPEVAPYRMVLAKSYSDFGILYRHTCRPEDAERLYRQAQTLQEQLYVEYPGDSDLANDFAATLMNLGIVLTVLGRPEEALDRCYLKAEEVLAEVLRREPEQRDAVRFLGDLHSDRAESLDVLDRHDDALHEWNTAIAVCKGNDKDMVVGRAVCLAHKGQSADARATIDKLLTSGDFTHYVFFEAARVYALCSLEAAQDPILTPTERARSAKEHADRAIDLLTKAFAQSYPSRQIHRARLAVEKDFTALRARPEFQKLLARGNR
jgi:serine/threonine-protein kinase